VSWASTKAQLRQGLCVHHPVGCGSVIGADAFVSSRRDQLTLAADAMQRRRYTGQSRDRRAASRRNLVIGGRVCREATAAWPKIALKPEGEWE